MSLLRKVNQWVSGSADNSIDNNISDSHFTSLLSSLMTMAWFVEARDPYTGGHLWRVSKFSELVALKAGLSKDDAARISLGGFLHDLGKVGIPDAILRKTDKLTDAEYEIIKTHPDIGFRMLSGHPLADLVKDAVLLHHERPDGRGYPQGLKAEDISDMAKVVGLCDAFDAMTSSRPYRAGMPQEKALSIIAANKGTQFDPGFADALIALGEAGELAHIIGHSDEGIPLQSCPSCGPTIVVQRESQVGDHLHCPSCTGSFALEKESNEFHLTPLNQAASAKELEPKLDTDLINRQLDHAITGLNQKTIIKHLA